MVVPVHRGWKDAARLLEELGAGPPGWSLMMVVVDDGSGDRGLDDLVARDWPFPVVGIRRASQGGFAAAANTGLRTAARGEILAVLNSDLRIRPDTLGQLLDAAAATPGIHGPAAVDEHGRPLPSARSWPTLGRMLAEFAVPLRALPRLDLRLRDFVPAPGSSTPVDVDWLAGSCLIFSETTWRDVGPFDETYGMYVEEVDWQRRAADAGLPRRYHPSATTIHHRDHTLDGGRDGDLRFARLWRARYRYLSTWAGTGAVPLLRLGMLAVLIATTPAWLVGLTSPAWRARAWRQMRRHWRVLFVRPAQPW